jgi:pyruvate dehydrogenase E1 component beta subunit
MQFATDIVALVASKAFSVLKAAVSIVAPPHTPVPFSPALEDAYVPNSAKIEAATLAVIG